MDTRQAAQRWADVWERGWPAHDEAAIGALYASTLGLALVYLGEHYATDLVGGAILAETVRVTVPRVGPRAMRVAARLEALRG